MLCDPRQTEVFVVHRQLPAGYKSKFPSSEEIVLAARIDVLR